MKKSLLIILILFFCLFLPMAIWALAFTMPPHGDEIIGDLQAAQVQPGDDYSTIAERYDVGYYELFEANPGVDPDNLKPGTILVIPTQYILPDVLHNNIVINLAEMRLYYASAGLHQVFTYPIGIGKEGWVTPTGSFKIIEKIVDPKWYVPKSIRAYRAEHGDPLPKIVPPGPDNPLGDYALRLSQRDYLIHGTNDPVGIGRRSSAGCIRMYPEDIKQLFALVHKGTPVMIINRPYKIGLMHDKVYLEAHMPLYEERITAPNDFSEEAEAVQKDITKLHATSVELAQILTIVTNHIGVPQIIG